jgi:hypothetical protein
VEGQPPHGVPFSREQKTDKRHRPDVAAIAMQAR